MDDVVELLMNPKELIVALPLQKEIRSIQGNNVVMYINAFGLRGDIAMGITTSRTLEKVTVKYSLIGEIVLGRYLPPRSDLNITITASRSEENTTEVMFEVFVKSSFLREFSVSREVDTFLLAIPEVFTNTVRRLKEAKKMKQQVAPAPVPSRPITLEVVQPSAPVSSSVEVTSTALVVPERVPERPSRPAERGETIYRYIYSDLLEDPVFLYKLITSGQFLTTVDSKSAAQLVDTLIDISSKHQEPLYAVVKEKIVVRLILENGVVLGILAEKNGQTVKGADALELLKGVTEGVTCFVYRINKEVLESFK